MKSKLLFLLLFVVNISFAQDIGFNHFNRNPFFNSQIGVSPFAPQTSVFVGSTLTSQGFIGNYYGVSFQKYNETLKGDISVGYSYENFNNNFHGNNFNLTYSKTLKITNNFSIIPSVQVNYFYGGANSPSGFNNSSNNLFIPNMHPLNSGR